MVRRGFLLIALGSALAAPLAVEAQQSGRVFRIGLIASGSPSPSPTPRSQEVWLYERLQELGWIYGRNLVAERRAYGDRIERTPELAAELIRTGVDVFVVEGGSEAALVQQVTRSIPIVTLRAGDLVEMGVVTNLARPGSNITGIQTLQSDLVGKELSLLREAMPSLSRSGILLPEPPSSPFLKAILREASSAAKALGIDLQIVSLQSPNDLEKAFSTLVAERAQGVVVVRSAYLSTHVKTMADLAMKHHLLTISDTPWVPRNGGLMSYGHDPRGVTRSAAEIIDKILRGAKVSETPIQQATTFRLVVNRRTAKAIGLAIPAPLLGRADEVID